MLHDQIPDLVLDLTKRGEAGLKEEKGGGAQSAEDGNSAQMRHGRKDAGGSPNYEREMDGNRRMIKNPIVLLESA
jgi:hypothetical protein